MGGGGSEEEHILFPKHETLDFKDTLIVDNAAAISTTSHVKSTLIEMGFNSSLAQKAIDENGVDDLELLVEILTKTTVTQPIDESKQEPDDIQHGVDGKRMQLLAMKFPENLVDFALSRLGKDVPMDETINFIIAAQLVAEDSEELLDGSTETKREDEMVFVSLPSFCYELPLDKIDKTSQLLEMGFSRQEISVAIEKIGKEAQISHLAELIITGEVPADVEDIEKKVSAIPSTTRACPSKSWRFVGVASQEKDCGEGSSSGIAKVEERSVSKRIKVEDDRETDFDNRGKRLRPGYMGGSRSVIETPGMQEEESIESLSTLRPSNVAKRPYVFYGNIGELSPQQWSKISGFFFGIQPEHVDTRLYSALCRKEGYFHNLPIENRFPILPKPSQSAPSIISPENLERVMGYPPNHTNIGGARSAERLKLLDYCFQTDTLGYHLSVLKPLFPQGLTVLSLFSGIGGAEIALNRLGIHLKSVYSVEPCGLSRNILKRWWQTSGQTGELEQIEDIRILRAKKLETLVKRFGGFDLVICQNPPTPLDLSKESSRSQGCKFDYMLFNEVVCVSKCVKALMES
ncbi:unnamed protein product [Eruca vesicaria subsp. sativa]|uniref:Uncharacterized protein n=1 Tax=Eruca vesicaria subsp. sativa TaxID=29727 RepID=A0ABC8J9H3_ERUVS|nr:unnamed protein product [Eruca vesicaria subsp. sativa]